MISGHAGMAIVFLPIVAFMSLVSDETAKPCAYCTKVLKGKATQVSSPSVVHSQPVAEVLDPERPPPPYQTAEPGAVTVVISAEQPPGYQL